MSMAIIADNTGTPLDHLEAWAIRQMDPALRWAVEERGSRCQRCAHYCGHQSALFVRCGDVALSLAGGQCPQKHCGAVITAGDEHHSLAATPR